MICILAKLSAHPAYADAFQYIIVGIIIVIVALLVLSGFISGVGVAFRKNDAKPKPLPAADPVSTPGLAAVHPAVQAKSPAPASDAAGGIDEGVLAALIAAAVHVALDGIPHRVVHIEPISVGWAREGRRDIFSSHRVR